jgi:hypothetical protein
MLFRHWAKYPTIRDMVAGYLGVKPPDGSTGQAPSRPLTEEDYRQAFLMHGQSPGRS